MTITNITERERELSARVDELEAQLAAIRAQEPIAVVGNTYSLLWIGAEPIAKLLGRFTHVKVGSYLYAAAGAQPSKENDATLKINLEFDEGEVEIVAHGTTLNMQRLEARLKRGLAADKELATLKAQEPIGAVGDMESGRAIRWYDYHTKLPARTLIYLAAGAQPVPEGMALVSDAIKQDAERYQWLTADLSTSDGRVERNELLSRMSVMSYSDASRDIDAAMLAAAKETK